MKGKIFVIGIGPGSIDNMTLRAYNTIKQCDVIVGYTVYIEQIQELCQGKEIIQRGMGKEIERCELSIEKAKEGHKVGLVCSGDAALYGMMGPMLEVLQRSEEVGDIEVEAIPGVTSALASASLLGAPIVEDFCTISLSDYMVPWEQIITRLEKACEGNFTIALYNPRSRARQEHLVHALEIIKKYRQEDTPVGIVRNAYREEQSVKITTLKEINVEEVDMFCTLIIGNHKTYIADPFMITSRGYTL